jgi:hypothetical protein
VGMFYIHNSSFRGDHDGEFRLDVCVINGFDIMMNSNLRFTNMVELHQYEQYPISCLYTIHTLLKYSYLDCHLLYCTRRRYCMYSITSSDIIC